MSSKIAKKKKKKKNIDTYTLESPHHKVYVKLQGVMIVILALLFITVIGLVIYYNSFYHNELGKVKLECSDNSIMYVEEDGTFKWYRAKWGKDEQFDSDVDYLAGVMRYYTGAEAYKILDENSDKFWGITSESIEGMYDEYDRKEDMFIMIVEGTYFVTEKDGEMAKASSDFVKYYLGFNDGWLHTMESVDDIERGHLLTWLIKRYDL